MTSPALLLAGVIFLLLLFIGIFAATIVYLGKGQSKKQPTSPQLRDQPVAPPTLPAKEPPPPSEPALEAPARAGEVMRVIRDPQTSRVLIEVDGKTYAHIREITDASIGRRVLWAIADLVRFTGGMATNPQALRTIQDKEPARHNEQPPTNAPTAAPAQPPSTSTTARRSVPPTTPASPSVSSLAVPPAASEKNQRYSLLGFFKRGFERPAPGDALATSMSFIDEIEEILQGYITNLSTPLPYDVHVLTGEDGTLQIKVGGSVYSSPDQVPETEARELIKAAVAEWEKK
jgi:hypothetical protein